MTGCNLSQNSKSVGLVFNIQSFSVHDGPGIRTMVFLKGCPLRCRWCSNPESQWAYPEPALNAARCLGLKKCGLCLGSCRGLTSGPDDKPILVRSHCRTGQSQSDLGDFGRHGQVGRGLDCQNLCPAGALVVYGRPMEAREVIIAVKNDSVFHNRSGGGLTVTGGEPLSQPDFLLTLLSLAKGQRLNTAMETSGQAPFEILSQAATKLDSLFYDLKIIDRRKHLEFTGVESTLILDNLLKIYSKFPDLPITVRTPVVPGFNNDRFSAQEIGLFLRKLPNVSFEALPYHSFGSQKYGYLGRPYGLPESGLAESDLSEFNQTVLEYRHGDQSIRTALP